MVFEVFRKNQKQLLVALTALAMLAFILGGLLDSLFARAGRGYNPEVATMWGRSVKASDVNEFREGRRIVNEFVRIARQEVGLPPIPPFPMNDSGILDSMLLLGKAERMGIVVDDSDVTQFLNRAFDRKLDAKKFSEIISGRATIERAEESGSRDNFAISEQQLYSLLARELKIQRVEEAIFPAAALSSPYRTWESHEPAMTRVQLELVRMPLEKYVDANAKPDEEAVKQLYEKFKNQRASSVDETPGFLIPRRVEVQYLEASVDKFAEQTSVTDEEIKTYYEANKSQFRMEDASVPLPGNLPPPPGASGPVPPIPSPPTNLPPPPAETAVDPKPSETSKQSDKPAPPKAASEKKKAEVDKGAKEDAAKKPSGETKTSSSSGWNAWLSTVSGLGTLIQNGNGKTADKPDDAQKKTGEANPAAAKKGEAKADAVPAAPIAPAPPVESPKPEDKFKPLEQVKEEISRTLKRQKARKLIVEKMEKILRDVMYGYQDRYAVELRTFRSKYPEAAKTGDLTEFKPSPPPDLAKLAQEMGFELKNTGLVDFDAASKLPKLGTAMRVGSGFFDDERFSQFVFRQDNYRGRIVRDVEDMTYFLYWKVKDEPEKTAKFEDVREEVVRLWREEQAIPKAKEAAEKLAEEAKKAGGDLEKVLGKDSGLSVFTTGEFTKASRRRQDFEAMSSAQLFYNEVPGVPNAGADFINAVFKMKPGDIQVLADNSKRIHYVVKVKNRVEPDFNAFVQDYNFQQIYSSIPRFATQQREFAESMQFIASGLAREAGFRSRLGELMGQPEEGP